MSKKYELKLKFLPVILALKQLDTRKWFTDVPPMEIFGLDYIEETQPLLNLTVIETKLEKEKYRNENDVVMDISSIFINVVTRFPIDSILCHYARDLYSFFKSRVDTSTLDQPLTQRRLVPPPDYDRLRNLQYQVQILEQQLETLKSLKNQPVKPPPPVVRKRQKQVEEPKIIQNRAVSYAEKARIGQEVAQLPAEQIRKVVDIIRRVRPSMVEDTETGDVDIDMSVLDAPTLREIQGIIRETKMKS